MGFLLIFNKKTVLEGYFYATITFLCSEFLLTYINGWSSISIIHYYTYYRYPHNTTFKTNKYLLFKLVLNYS